jgi:hypothetical protein
MFLRSYSRIAVGLLTLFCLSMGISTSAWAGGKEQVLYSFQGTPDGAVPVGGVAFDSTGNLYGATTEGGAAGSSCNSDAQCGTVFQMKQKNGTWSETVLHVFEGNLTGDGATPAGGLIVDASNHLFGTTAYGGTGDCLLLGGEVGCGTIYEMTPPTTPGESWTETVIYSFQGGSDGYFPMGNLVFDDAGNLYGATYYGGGFGVCNQGIYPYCGTIFELSPPRTKGSAWTEKVLYSFKSDTDGANPNGSLVFDTKGALYGTTFFGGNQGCPQDAGVGCGTVFKLSPPAKKGLAWGYEVLYRFNDGGPQQAQGDGENPAAGVVLGEEGVIYGTTERGVTADGTIFVLTPSKNQSERWRETILHFFANGNDGAFPTGLVVDGKGDLYGPTPASGSYGAGEIFRLKPPKKGMRLWNYTTLYNFRGSPDGDEPTGYLTLNGNNLYGVTSVGGTGPCQQGGCGTVFEFTPSRPYQ